MLELDYHQTVTTYINNIITYFDPQSYILLCVDGIPPNAKIEQQRERRYKTTIPSKSSGDVKIEYFTTIKFDTNQITHVTEFMLIRKSFKKLYLDHDEKISIVNIDIFKQNVIQSMTYEWSHNFSDYLVIQDFVVMVYYIGNDFVPHMISLENIMNSLNIMIE